MAIKTKVGSALLIALGIHVVILAFLGPKYIVSPHMKEVLLKGKLKEKKKRAAAPTRDIKPTIEKKVTADVPVHLLKKVPVAKKKMKLDKKVKVPTTVKVPKTVVPKKDVHVSRKHKSGSTAIVSRERVRRRQTYKKFTKKFFVSGKGRATKATFTPVLTKYAGGDWNKDQKSLPNLMTEINRRSNIKATVTPKIVGAASKDIFDCPFVYFTGTKDFKFTEAEVLNLRKYLLQGGLVWADNGLPGRRSRFDMAFRRGMKRVMPDRRFEAISRNHPIFTSFYKFREVPSAMNFRKDPIEVMKIDKRIAVIYTLNDYVAFWRTRFNEKGEVLPGYDEDWEWNCGNYWLSWNRWQYENLSVETVENAYRLGVNIVAYLLTR